MNTPIREAIEAQAAAETNHTVNKPSPIADYLVVSFADRLRLAQEAVDRFKASEPSEYNLSCLRYWTKIAQRAKRDFDAGKVMK